MRLWIKTISIICIVVFSILMCQPLEKAQEVSNCRYLRNDLSYKNPEESTKLILQPNGPFAVMVFDEGAFSIFIGVIYYKSMSNPFEGSWPIKNRFWQKGEWVSDVTSVAWGRSGRYLYVSTSVAYGLGYVYRLELLNRKSERIFPTDEYLRKHGIQQWNYGTEIIAIHPKTSTMTVSAIPGQSETKQKPIKIELKYE